MRTLIAVLSLSAVVALAVACETSPRSSNDNTADTDNSESAKLMTVVAAEPVAAAPVAAVVAEPVAAEAAAEAEAGSCGGSCGGGESCGGKSCGCEAAMATRAPRNVPSDAVWTEVAVKGMRCGGCEKKIEAALANLDGVYDVDADFSSGNVRIATAPAERNVRDRVVPQIESLGFRAQ